MNRNKSVSDFVAATMDAVLRSEEHKSLFGTQYKFASDENDAKAKKCSKCGKDMDSCMCDSAMADDNDARKKKDSKESSSDSSSASDMNDARKKKDSEDSSSDSSSADDDNDARKKKDSSSDDSSADDADAFFKEEKVSSAFDVAIDSLLTASAAMDSVGL